ncbi:hypothetical protein C8A01DRAFT_20420 [Parachaetomium inaequale]|uniref:Uncharacterized protein n=1 Tax=Parachaetomium inaequale TaxID=2588326 RepID=A0AAN6P9Z8_9PEZI|nr:hypothetical protein C8A01DRAFT_20420 [Parachaetomium inaequale]
MEDRRRLATPELTHWVKKIKKKMTSSPPLGELNDAGPGFRPGYVLRLRLSRREREMLEVAAADEGGRDPPLPGAGPPGLAKQVAALLFLRWSFANHALRELLRQLVEIEPDAESSTADEELRRSFAAGLATRLDHFLPFDNRGERMTELLADPENKGLWDTLQGLYRPNAKTLDENRPDRFAVAPHPADEKIWLGLAYKTIKKHHVMRRWPGVHEAAAFAAQQLGVHDTTPEYPYHGTWFSDHLAATAAGKHQRGRPNAYSRRTHPQISAATSDDVEGLVEGFEDLRLSSEYPQYEEEWVETIRASVDAADVWDLWTLPRMLKCESASQELTDSEQNLLRAAVPQGPPDLTKECPLSILDPKEFVEVARYDSPKYKLHHITSETLVAECLINAGFQTTGNWDLVCLEDTQQDNIFPEHIRHFDHHRHAFYITEDVTSRYLVHNYDMLGLTAPCRCYGCECPEQPDESEIDDDFSHNAHCRFHHGGEVVFARRRLDNTPFARNLDRYWIDWNDCMLILGRGKDDDGNLIDGSTAYLLETLPGIKLRAIKDKALDEASGLASACLFLNLKIENRSELDLSRSVLQSIMGTRYHPRFKDFTYLIDESCICWEDDFRSEDDSSYYGSTYLARRMHAGVYNQQGNLIYNSDYVVVKLMAESDQESSDQREDMFCRKLEAFYDFVAGNRIKNTVAFLGFVSVPVDSSGKMLAPGSPSATYNP